MTKRITALAILLAFILTMGGCYDASYVVKSGDVTILPGVYLIIQLNAYTNLAEKMGVGSDFDSLSIKEQMKQLSPIDQRDAYTWVKDLTNQDLTTYIATEKLFAENVFSLSDEELAEIKNDSRQLYEQNKAYFESNGIGLESYKAWITNQYKNKYLFKSIYYENGTNPVSLEEQKAAFAADYAKLKVIQIPIYKYDAEYGAYVDLDEDTIKELEGKAAEMVERINNGTSIDVVNAEWELEQGYVKDKADVEPLEAETFEMDTANYTGNMINEVKKLEFGKAAFEKDINFKTIFVYQKFDPLETDTQFEYFKYRVVYKLKQTEFITYLNDYMKEQTVETNEKLVEKYSPYKIKKYSASLS